MIRRIFQTGALAILVSACATTPDAHFYALSTDGAPNVATSALSLAIGPVDLPRYLDRPQIVTRDGENRLRVDEFNRWGGSLEEEIHRVLASRLGSRLGTQRIYTYPSRIVAATDYRVALEISVFDGTLGGQVRLDAAWSLIDDRTADVLTVQRVQYTGRAAGVDYGAYAAALSGLLRQMADDLAVGVRQAKKRLCPS